MAINPVSTPAVQPGSSAQAPSAAPNASADDVAKLNQALDKPKNIRDLSESELLGEIKQLQSKAAVYPGLSDDEKVRLTHLTSEQSDRSRRRPEPERGTNPGANILKNM
jgi:hypothetical protein